MRPPPFLAIDPVGTMTADDAVWAETVAEGGWLVRVAIVDMTRETPPGGAEDARARIRELKLDTGLPPDAPVAYRHPGLVEDADNRCFVTSIHVAVSGRILSCTTAPRGDVRVVRLSHERAAKSLESRNPGRSECMRALVDAMLIASWRRLARQGDEGSIEFMRKVRESDSRTLVLRSLTEAMLLVNMDLSRRLLEARRPALWAWGGQADAGDGVAGRPHHPGTHAKLTTPARTYASLVNQRCIAALLAGNPEPHGREWMGRAARFIEDAGTAQRTRDPELRSLLAGDPYGDGTRLVRLAVQNRPEDFASLAEPVDESDMDRIYAWCMVLAHVPAGVERIMRRRGTFSMARDILRDRRLETLALRTALLDAMDTVHNEGIAMSLVNAIVQGGPLWGTMETVRTEGRVLVRLGRPGSGDRIEGKECSGHPKQARRRALLTLVAALCGMRWKPPEPRVALDAQGKAQEAGGQSHVEVVPSGPMP